MDTARVIKHWVTGAERDYKSAAHMLETGEYVWCLFVGHLCIEKLLKAYHIKQHKDHPLRIHNLKLLAQRAGLSLTDELEMQLTAVTHFNMESRYQNERQNFYQSCTQEYTEKWFGIITNLRTWIKTELSA